MNYAFRYTARSARGKVLDGILYAPSLPLAYARLKKTGFSPMSVKKDWMATLRHLVKPGFNPKELARLYKTLGRRMEKGKPVADGLDSAIEYLSDQKLRQSAMAMRQSILDGQSEAQAMADAGFPSRDALVIKSTADAGQTGQTFLSLAKELEQSDALKRSVKSVFRMPILMAFLMYLFFYGALVAGAPMTMKFLKQTNMKLQLGAFVRLYFDFATFFNANLVVCSAIFFTLPALAIYFFKSKTFHRLLDQWALLRTLSVKSDHAMLWSSFGLLYDAAIPMKESCAILAQAATRSDSRVSFMRLARLIEGGRPLEEAITLCHFPSFVVAGIRSAVSGGAVVEGVKDMVGTLEEDVLTITELLKEYVKYLSTLMVAVGIGLIFFVTYYPMVASVMSNL